VTRPTEIRGRSIGAVLTWVRSECHHAQVGSSVACHAIGACEGDPERRMSRVPHREHGEPSDTRALVAHVTRCRCSRNVSGRLDHAATRTGVTGIAGACGNPRVIETCACEAHKARVAGDAIGRCGDVVGGFRDGRDAGEGLSVVTGGAARGDARVVHGRVRAEGCRALMTRRAILAGGDVVGGFADDTARTGVTAGAARGDAGVIERRSREAHKARVAADAISRRCNVVGGFGDGCDTGEDLSVVTGGAA